MTIKPWTRWWWMGNAVDTVNLKYHLLQFKEVGIGGVEITPIYGVKGYEDQFIPYLSEDWMKMLDFTCSEAKKLGLGVDINNGTGWPFGGPQISKKTAAQKAELKKIKVTSRRDSKAVIQQIKDEAEISLSWQALNIFSQDQQHTLSPDIDSLTMFLSQNKSWPVIIYSLFVKNTMQQVKRVAPGGEGLVMDHYSEKGINTYLERFDEAFKIRKPEHLRAVFNDSYEVYDSDWTLDLLNEFKTRHAYNLADHLSVLAGDGDNESVKRVRADYRQTVADLILNEFTIPWHNWTNKHGLLSRNQAHGSPGNLIDLYASADIPEIEIFGYSHFDLTAKDRLQLPLLKDTTDFLMLKFASSAANLSGKKLVSSESFTWLRDHFNVSLSDIKPEADQLFTSGVNHLFFHGSTYSPKNENWPGWLFYASTHFNPSTSWWNDLKVLNEYIATCQYYLQNSRPDNDILLYWPVSDIWAGEFHDTGSSILQTLSIHNQNEWLKPSPFYKTAKWLHENGYSFDYVSDAFLMKAEVLDRMAIIGKSYKTIIVPACKYIPFDTQEKLNVLSDNGVSVLYLDRLPLSVPGLRDFRIWEENLHSLHKQISSAQIISDDHERALDRLLQVQNIRKESFVQNGIEYIRKKTNEGYIYFLTNLSAAPYTKWTELSVSANTVMMVDGMTNSSGLLATRTDQDGKSSFLIELLPGQSCILIISDMSTPDNPWMYYQPGENSQILPGNWTIKFLNGGPELPDDISLDKLKSWSSFGNPKYHIFSGTAEYITYFDNPLKDADAWLLKFDQVKESARIWINGKEVGFLIAQPWQILINAELKEKNNLLRIEVTNLDANRIRNLDRTDPSWKKFHDINFVDIHYEQFDASSWEPIESGIIGDVKLIPLKISFQSN
ncbi:glycosyl hydrolase [Bacteroidota bacterium]